MPREQLAVTEVVSCAAKSAGGLVFSTFLFIFRFRARLPERVFLNLLFFGEKFVLADDIFDDIPAYTSPEAGFFLWLACQNGEEAALKLWKEDGIRVLPGRYLSQDVNNQNPGHGYIRVALVAPKDQIEIGLRKLRNCLYK
jgi:hypothetical protein